MVAVPMYQNDATALRISFDPHNIAQPFHTNQNFIWPEGMALETAFPQHASNTVVLAFLPCAFALSYQCGDMPGEELARARQFFHDLSQDADFTPIHAALTLIMSNDGRSFIRPTSTEGGEAGIDVASLRDNMIRDLGGASALREEINAGIVSEPPFSADAKLVILQN